MRLLEEAVDYAGAYIAGKISAAENAVALLHGLVDDYRRQLIRSDYRAGCPIVAVTVEAGDPDHPERTTKLIERAAEAFALCTDLARQRLVAEGVATPRAEELAMLVTASIEGAIVVARASSYGTPRPARSCRPDLGGRSPRPGSNCAVPVPSHCRQSSTLIPMQSSTGQSAVALRGTHMVASRS